MHKYYLSVKVNNRKVCQILIYSIATNAEFFQLYICNCRDDMHLIN